MQGAWAARCPRPRGLAAQQWGSGPWGESCYPAVRSSPGKEIMPGGSPSRLPVGLRAPAPTGQALPVGGAGAAEKLWAPPPPPGGPEAGALICGGGPEELRVQSNHASLVVIVTQPRLILKTCTGLARGPDTPGQAPQASDSTCRPQRPLLPALSSPPPGKDRLGPLLGLLLCQP